MAIARFPSFIDELGNCRRSFTWRLRREYNGDRSKQVPLAFETGAVTPLHECAAADAARAPAWQILRVVWLWV